MPRERMFRRPQNVKLDPEPPSSNISEANIAANDFVTFRDVAWSGFAFLDRALACAECRLDQASGGIRRFSQCAVLRVSGLPRLCAQRVRPAQT